MSIDKEVPLPPPRAGSLPRYQFASYEVGDSEFFPGGDQVKLNAVAWNYKKRGLKFATRSGVENGVKGVRVWRTA